MSGTHAATPEELDTMATCLGNQSTATDAIIKAVDGQLGNTSWTGPGRNKFDDQWSTARTAMGNLILALEGASTECMTRAANTRVALG